MAVSIGVEVRAEFRIARNPIRGRQRHLQDVAFARTGNIDRGRTRRPLVSAWVLEGVAAVILVCLTFLIGGCRIAAPSYRPGFAEHAPEVAIVPFSSASAASQYSGSTDFGNVLTENLAGALQEQGIRAVVVPSRESIPSGTRYVISGELIAVDPGSWNLRFWIGFAAGRARMSARVAVEDLVTKHEVFDDVMQSRSMTWQKDENILRRCSGALSRGFAQRIGPIVRRGIVQ